MKSENNCIKVAIIGCAVSLILAGCSSSSDFGQFANIMGSAAGMTTGENSQLLGIVSQQSAIAGEQQRQLEIQQQQQRQQDAYASQQVLGQGAYVFDDSIVGKLLIVTCNDGGGCDPNNFSSSKFTNIKTVFSQHETLQVCVDATFSMTGFGYTVTDQSGQLVRHSYHPNDDWQYWSATFSEANNTGLLPGNYAFNLYINDSLRKTIYFRVTSN